ncbi:ribulose phosphate epimerase [Mycoplasmopsis pullorum]|uniref:ribulose phosphate epimerase n=1 Tax=Mycoplasmopsis pullorum TaxID=48003 RepID=UPI001117DC08|nr:ribulose phosphate epimerase [Mycoplasmopsis pullorum]TNK82201.1 ribulose phosphate epimerase [Mycoplasmopsis pullorum]TNK83173.1 ribulose phosphate epimerase [Mycoplasmopsis pullorum]TNK84671.1 ribulose phosphate epimerase [Mycoplasmopsis pullorum]TNK85458.1 ribulose phosphate epimerase [Mycoplasmopsis pullorum]TNK85886.1 ribulose phosphate epimerase [Mycoplasmopsis pullorum]
MKYSQSLCALNLFKAETQIDQLVNDGLEYIHLDLVDYHYAPSFGLNFQTIDYIINKYPELNYDIHAMVDDIEIYLPQIHKMKIQRLSFPMDKADVNLLNKLKKLYQPIQFGIMIEAHNLVDPELINACDFVVLMTIDKIGGTGVKLNPTLLDKVSQIREIKPQMMIISDGGLRVENAHLFKQVNVDVAVGGSIIFNYPHEKYENFMDYWNNEVDLERD